MPRYSIFRIGASSLLLSLGLISCSGTSPVKLGISATGLAPCPSSPNCVSSDAHDPEHQTPPFELSMPADQAWPLVRESLSQLKRTRIVSENSEYLHAECRSFIFGFVDDFELNLRASKGIIAVRSASRLGYSDFGVNRRRVEELRASLKRQGVIAENLSE